MITCVRKNTLNFRYRSTRLFSFLFHSRGSPAGFLKVSTPSGPIIFYHYPYTTSFRGCPTSLESLLASLYNYKKRAKRRLKFVRRVCRLFYCVIQKDSRLTGSGCIRAALVWDFWECKTQFTIHNLVHCDRLCLTTSKTNGYCKNNNA